MLIADVLSQRNIHRDPGSLVSFPLLPPASPRKRVTPMVATEMAVVASPAAPSTDGTIDDPAVPLAQGCAADTHKAAAHDRLPIGDVTFMFTDIEGSTRLLQILGEATYRDALDRHYSLLREQIARTGGVEVRTVGDAMFAAFADPGAALRACADIQLAIAAEPWPASTRFAVRIGLHRGPAEPYHDDYVGLAVHKAARIAASAHGGQVVVSATVRQATTPERDGLQLVTVGEHVLKDFSDPIELHQLAGHGLQRNFPALSTPRWRRRRLAGGGCRRGHGG
jgi:class 3 adenylate cyclase